MNRWKSLVSVAWSGDLAEGELEGTDRVGVGSGVGVAGPVMNILTAIAVPLGIAMTSGAPVMQTSARPASQ